MGQNLIHINIAPAFELTAEPLERKKLYLRGLWTSKHEYAIKFPRFIVSKHMRNKEEGTSSISHHKVEFATGQLKRETFGNIKKEPKGVLKNTSGNEIPREKSKLSEAIIEESLRPPLSAEKTFPILLPASATSPGL